MPCRDLIRNQAGYTEVCPHLSRMSEVKATRRSPTRIYATNRKPLSMADCCLRPVMGSFPHNPYSNQYLPVVTDHFTKLAELFPLQKLLSQKIWDRLLAILTIFGFLAELMVDHTSGARLSRHLCCAWHTVQAHFSAVFSLLYRLAVRWQMHHMHSERKHKSSTIYYWLPGKRTQDVYT